MPSRPWGRCTEALVIALHIQIALVKAYSHSSQAIRSRSQLSTLTRTTGRPHAAVYGDNETAYPDNSTQTVEFLRFVTAYRVGLESIVDVTPFSALLSAASGKSGELGFYAFVDTWVNNDTGSEVLYLSNESGTCSGMNVSDGNGWSLSAELIFWPEKPDEVDTKPKASVTLGSGFFGGNFKIGSITIHEGALTNNRGTPVVHLDEKAHFEDTQAAKVFKCPLGAGQISRAAFIGYIAQQAGELHTLPEESKAEALQALEDEYTEYIAEAYFSHVNVLNVYEDNASVEVQYDTEKVQPGIGMGVYFGGSVITDDELEPGFWVNASYPFKPVGEVTAMYNGTLMLKMNTKCLPNSAVNGLPPLSIPNNPSVLGEARTLVKSAMAVGKARDMPLGLPALLQPHADGVPGQVVSESAIWGKARLDIPVKVGELILDRDGSDHDEGDDEDEGRDVVALQLASGVLQNVTDSEKVCVVQQQHHGHIFNRKFKMPGRYASTDSVVMQLAVTGHGWAETTEQCGEYCHAVYQITIDGVSAANVTQFRDDCIDNPIDGNVQHGTWDQSRNGWCPGSVEPGLFVDVTKFIKAGKRSHNISLDVVVWSNHTHRYMPYVDYGGFAFGDQASLIVGMTMFVYDEKAVHAIRKQNQSFTPAEKALRNGCNNPKLLRPPEEVGPTEYQVLLQTEQTHTSALRGHVQAKEDGASRRVENFSLTRRSARKSRRYLSHVFLRAQDDAADPSNHQKKLRVLEGNHTDSNGRFDFLDTAPWYLYNMSADGRPGAEAGTKTVKIFKQSLMQGATRTVYRTLQRSELPTTWSQAALRIRLQKPKHLEIDHWDRVASFGMTLGGSGTSKMQLHPAHDHGAHDRAQWRVDTTE